MRRSQGCFGVFVAGYDNDHRELFEISEVRDYFQALHAVWPYGLYFFARSTETLQLLVLCHASVRLTAEAPHSAKRFASVDKKSVLEFLTNSLPGLSEVTSKIGWPPQAARRFVREIALSFGIRANDRIEEPRLFTRQLHFAFLTAQYRTLAAIAWRGFQEKGRGAIMVPPPGPDNQSGCTVFFSSVDEMDSLDCFETDGEHVRLINAYDPTREIVVAIDDDDVTSTYRYGDESLPPPDAWEFMKDRAFVRI